MKRILWVGMLAWAVACGSNPSIIPAGDFAGPTGLAVAPLPDRDLLFVANQGSNELRAITLCTAPAGTATTCSSNEDGRLLPAPVRLFPGSILAGERPLRLAGARLKDAMGAPHGAVLVTGSDPTLRIIDAASILAASQSKDVTAAPRKEMLLPQVPIDVVATDADGESITAIVATQPSPGKSAAITVLSVALGPDGPEATLTQQCTVDFVPARLALIPGLDDLDTQGRPKHLYVADATPGGTPGGTGDGAVEVSVADIPPIATPAPCPVTRRLPASDPAESPRAARPLTSIALSPAYVDAGGTPVPGGQFLLGATGSDPALCTTHLQTCPDALGIPAGAVCADHGFRSCGRGRLLILNTNIGGQSQIVRAPPASIADGTAPPMVPLSAAAPATDVTFLGRPSCPQGPAQECTGLRLIASGNSTQLIHPSLIGVVSAEDGSVTFLDVFNRRFFSDARDTNNQLISPEVTKLTLLQPGTSVDHPSLVFAPVEENGTAPGASSRDLTGWLNEGVTRSAQWKVVWHGVMPGLESVSGNLSRSAGSSTVTLDLLPPGRSLAQWISAPELRLGAPSACALPYPQCVGDFVRILSYSRTDACPALATVPTAVDVPIAAIDAGGTRLQLQAVPGFDPGPECGTVAATVEVRAGTTTAGAWTVVEGLDALGRLPHGSQFVVTGPRFDYPSPILRAIPPARDLVVSFTVGGPEPTTPDTTFTFPVNDHRSDPLAVTTVRAVPPPGTFNLASFGGPMLVYSSPRRTDQVVFTAGTGSNLIMASTPAQFGVSNPNPSFLY